MSESNCLDFLDQSGVTYLIIGLLFIGLGIITYEDFFQCEYIQLRNHADWTTVGGYTVPQFVALVIGTFTFPLGLIFMLIYALQSAKNSWGYYNKIFIYLLISSLFGIATFFSYHMSEDVLSCGIFCIGTDGTENIKNDAAIISTGIIYFITSVFLSLLFFLLALLTIFSFQNPVPQSIFEGMNSYSPAQYLIKPQFKRTLGPQPRRLSIAFIIFTFGFFYPLILFACLSLPTWWAYFDKYDIQKYQASLPSQSYGAYWSLTLGESQTFTLKLFPDILIFYGAIYLVALVGLLAELSSSLRLRLHTRPSFLPFNACVGEALLTIAFFTLILGQFCYWFFEHGWQQQARSSRTSLEIAARSIGQVSNSVAGLLVLPISRHSVWTSLLGVSWDYMIAYHRLLGGLFLFLVAAHLFLWWGVYLQQHTFPHDIFSIPLLYHSDNFTVPLAFVVSVVVLFGGMGLTSYVTFRRAHYDLFLWTHHLSLVVFFLLLWHATMSWYYLAGGLGLFAFDSLLRLSASLTRSVHLEQISVKGEGNLVFLAYTISQSPSIWANLMEALFGNHQRSVVSEDEEDQEPLVGSSHPHPYSSSSQVSPLNFNPFTRDPYGPLPHQMGQYLFINIPIISQLAWHPFTISSAPGEPLTTHHIKAQFRHSPPPPSSSTSTSPSPSATKPFSEKATYQTNSPPPASSEGGGWWSGILFSIADSLGQRKKIDPESDDEFDGDDPLQASDPQALSPTSPLDQEQWTCKLLSLAASLSSVPRSKLGSIVINIDGPFGVPIQTSRYRNLLFLAGGIGITPLFSCYKHLFVSSLWGKERWKYAHIKKVKLVWVVRSYNEALVFEESLRDLHLHLNAEENARGSPPPGPQFSYSVFVTHSNSPSPPGFDSSSQTTFQDNPMHGQRTPASVDSTWKKLISGMGMSFGSSSSSSSFNSSSTSYPSKEGGGGTTTKNKRPDLLAEIRPLAPWGMEGLVYACGPPALVMEASSHAQQFNIDFKSESFEL